MPWVGPIFFQRNCSFFVLLCFVLFWFTRRVVCEKPETPSGTFPRKFKMHCFWSLLSGCLVPSWRTIRNSSTGHPCTAVSCISAHLCSASLLSLMDPTDKIRWRESLITSQHAHQDRKRHFGQPDQSQGRKQVRGVGRLGSGQFGPSRILISYCTVRIVQASTLSLQKFSRSKN